MIITMRAGIVALIFALAASTASCFTPNGEHWNDFVGFVKQHNRTYEGEELVERFHIFSTICRIRAHGGWKAKPVRGYDTTGVSLCY